MALTADKPKSLLNSILFIAKSFIPRFNIIPVLKKITGGKNLIIIIIKKKVINLNLKTIKI